MYICTYVHNPVIQFKKKRVKNTFARQYFPNLFSGALTRYFINLFLGVGLFANDTCPCTNLRKNLAGCLLLLHYICTTGVLRRRQSLSRNNCHCTNLREMRAVSLTFALYLYYWCTTTATISQLVRLQTLIFRGMS